MIILLLLLLNSCLCQFREPTNSRIVAIVATNDIHGHALPLNLTRVDTKQMYTQGGLATLGALINIVKKEYPGNTLYFDSGDQFQGGVESSPLLAGGKLLNQFMDYMQLDGAAIGNHEFDYGYQYLQDFLQSRTTANLAANIQDQSGHNLVFPKQKLSQIYTLANGIKIGAIGLTTKFTPKRSTGWVLSDKQIQGIQFRDYEQIVKSESARLRSQGANAVILVSHVGDSCHISDFTYGLWTKESKLSQCNKQGEISKLLNSLPRGTVDAVLQGHYHEIVHNYIQGVPVVGNRAGGKYFNILYLQFKEQRLVDSIIEGPIPVCEKVFRSTLQCQYIQTQKELASAGDLVSWRFHDSLVVPDDHIQRMMKQELSTKIEPFLEVVCYNEKLLKPSYNEETELNNLLGLAVQSQVPTADFTLLAPSLLRQTLYPGPITKLDLFNFHPFSSPFVVIKLLGEDFTNALKYLQTLEDSYHFSNQLEQTLWMTKNGQKRGLTSVRWYNGSEIDPKAEVTGVMHNFTLGFVEKQFHISRQRSFGIVRQVFETYLRQKQRIDKGWALVDKLRPRLIVKVAEKQPRE